MRFCRYFSVLLLGLSCCRAFLPAQSLTAERQAETIALIEETAADIRTLQGDFIQSVRGGLLGREVKVKGRMFYQKQGNKLRWEYTEPYAFSFVINANRVMMKTEEEMQTLDVGSNRLFEEIAGVMMNTFTGNCLRNKDEFKVKVVEEDRSAVTVELLPVRQEMLLLFSSLRLHFDSAKRMISDVRLISDGREIAVSFLGTEINADIDPKVFNIE